MRFDENDSKNYLDVHIQHPTTMLEKVNLP